MKKLLVVLALAFASVVTPSFANDSEDQVMGMKKPDVLEVLELRGEVSEQTAIQFKNQVDKINKNPKIRAVLLVVETPGGGAIATSNAYEELSKLKVPVVAWCTTVCASGGMYIMMSPSVKYSATRNDAIVGSIGVVAHHTNFSRLLDHLKIDNKTYKSGSLKDAGNPTRPETKEDQEYIQSIIMSLANGFYEVVEKSRGSKIKDWDAVKSARIFIGKDAVKVGLVDSVMTYEEALKKAKEVSKSKNIYTRDELREIAASATAGASGREDNVYSNTLKGAFGDLPALVEIIKEIRQGSSTRFEYRMPYSF
jgi:signal peptide peptidase SppA